MGARAGRMSGGQELSGHLQAPWPACYVRFNNSNRVPESTVPERVRPVEGERCKKIVSPEFSGVTLGQAFTGGPVSLGLFRSLKNAQG